MMNKDKIIQIATLYMKIWNANEDRWLDKLADKNITVFYSHFEKTLHGIEEYRKALRMTYEFFPDIKIEVEKIIPAENCATILWQYFGTHKNGNLFGIDANGKKVMVSGFTIIEFKNELIKTEYGIVDNLSLLYQVGALKK